ncbi:MAG: hypothetical protein NTW08_02260 [Gammaproteobacteria bacterium]|nr:hypothetical protein [Gammaproteobacteria bacterium]
MPGLTEFILFAEIAPYQLFRYAMDWERQLLDNQFAVHAWEQREPNALMGVLNAYAYVIPWIQNGPSQRITLDELRNIHLKCMAHSTIPRVFPGDLRSVDVEQQVAQLLHDFYEAGGQLTNTVTLVQRLVQLRPFHDGNLRVLCRVLLNALLMQQGLLPTLLNNVHQVEACSIEQVVLLVQEGMERTLSLANYVVQEDKHPSHFEPSRLPDDQYAEVTEKNIDCFLPNARHWMEVHPEQRHELSGFSLALREALV